MRTLFDLNTAQAITCYDQRLAARGLYAEQVESPLSVRELLAEMGAVSNDTECGGPYVTRWMDPSRNGFSSDRLVWVFLRDDAGRLIAKIGNRLDRIGEDTYRDFARLSVNAMHPDDRVLAPEDRFPPIMAQIRGNVVYSGDLYVHPDLRELRIVPDLMKLGYWLVQAKWPDMDWAVNYVRAFHGEMYSWTRKHWRIFEGFVDFSYPPSSDFREHWFTCATRDEFKGLLLEDHRQLQSEFLRWGESSSQDAGASSSPQQTRLGSGRARNL